MRAFYRASQGQSDPKATYIGGISVEAKYVPSNITWKTFISVQNRTTATAGRSNLPRCLQPPRSSRNYCKMYSSSKPVVIASTRITGSAQTASLGS